MACPTLTDEDCFARSPLDTAATHERQRGKDERTERER